MSALVRSVPGRHAFLPVSRLVASVMTVVSLALAAGCAPAIRRSTDAPPTPAMLAQLWVEPDDIAKRDLAYGPGGRRLMPAEDAVYKVTEADTTGFSRGYDVVDRAGRKWKIKLGEEAQTELVVSRVLWAIGFHQPPLYYVTSLKLEGGNPEDQGKPGRLRAEFGYDSDGDWSWHENPFVGTRQLHGLLVANLIMNNWDIKPSQNRIYEMEGGPQPRRRYVVQDLGASLGLTAWPTGNRNDIDSFEQQRLIKAVTPAGVEFDYDARHGELLKEVSAADVIWVCRLLDKITDAQWEAVFGAAQYPPDVTKRYIHKVKSKIQEGLALAKAEGARP